MGLPKGISNVAAAILCLWGRCLFNYFERAATLFESLAQNQSFYNTNKRTALASIVFFLRYNNYYFHMSTDEKIEWMVDVLKQKYSLTEIVGIIENHTTLSLD